MDDFEKLAFAGLEKDQYHILWVRHVHAAHHELHFIIPRAELYHGKAFNAFPPGWQKDFDVLRDMYNVRYGWARPDDPKRQRVCVPRQASLLQNRLKRLGQEIQASKKDKIHDLLVDYAKNAIAGGSVTDREELITAFAELGLTINRKGRDYITVKYGEHKVRLKGGIFHESWRIGAENTGQVKSEETPAGRSSASELGELQERLEQIVQKRFSYNRKRYAGTMQGKQVTHRPDKKELLHLSDRDYSFVFLIMAGSRLISFYMTSKIQSLEEQIQSLELQKQQAEKTLSALKTMGIVLQNINGKNFIILPEPLSAEAG